VRAPTPYIRIVFLAPRIGVKAISCACCRYESSTSPDRLCFCLNNEIVESDLHAAEKDGMTEVQATATLRFALS
jgi:hypothetical protein